MQANLISEQLSIAIPTYNRADILKENILKMLPELRAYNICIYISDDSSNDDTLSMVELLKNTYNNIVYCRNVPSLGHDRNCIRTLSMPTQEYIWYLGDSMYIENGGIAQLLQKINAVKSDFYVTNVRERNFTHPSQIYTDTRRLFSELAWHLTLTGCCIYRRQVIEQIDTVALAKNFPQSQIIFNRVVESCNLTFIDEVKVATNINKAKSYWEAEIFNVFANDWISLIDGVYKVNPAAFERIKVIKSHSKYTGIFGLKNMIKLRFLGILTLSSYLKNKDNIKLASHINKFAIWGVLFTPRFIFILIKFFHDQKIILKNK
ncbi:glycosyltransferase [Pseudoalteromonas sp. SR41-1]|uniref:glycosyltransferase family 2 protein n=1 Tax=Pseudoalteromonas sp. SR41-1 TaxID=2760952 RepID=UPI001601C776|nr:glycosyltransferase [Pseudoalteromonas sp. SR41-1]MBB1279865.1 glycosyltransferase [Pseudoalteromonas sp. SR41-1]